MIQPPVSPAHEKSQLWKAIAVAGFAAGTFDILSACTSAYLRSGVTPPTLLKFISMAAFGKQAMEGGAEMAITGLLFHYLIAYSWTTLFFLLYRKVNLEAINKVITGLLYGVIIWVVMNLLVLPLTHLPQTGIKLTQAIIGMAILMVAVGLPVSLFAHQYYQKLKA